MELQESSDLFNTDRLKKKQQETQLQQKKLSAFEAQLSMNQSDAVNSQELLSQKTNLMKKIEDIEKSFD